MEQNISFKEILIRLMIMMTLVIAGGFLLFFGLATIPAIVLICSGVLLLVTAIAGFCPLYSILGINTAH